MLGIPNTIIMKTKCLFSNPKSKKIKETFYLLLTLLNSGLSTGTGSELTSR